MKVLIVGSTGSIGRLVTAETIKRGHQARGPAHGHRDYPRRPGRPRHPHRRCRRSRRRGVHPRERYEQVQQLLTEGASRAEVCRRLGLDPQTVRRFADATSIEELLANTRRDTLIDAYTTHLNQRWNDGCTDTVLLYAESASKASAAACKPCAATCDRYARSRASPAVTCRRRARQHHRNRAVSPNGS